MGFPLPMATFVIPESPFTSISRRDEYDRLAGSPFAISDELGNGNGGPSQSAGSSSSASVTGSNGVISTMTNGTAGPSGAGTASSVPGERRKSESKVRRMFKMRRSQSDTGSRPTTVASPSSSTSQPTGNGTGAGGLASRGNDNAEAGPSRLRIETIPEVDSNRTSPVPIPGSGSGSRSASASATTPPSGPPIYAPLPASSSELAPIPSYELALSQSPTSPAGSSFLNSPNPLPRSAFLGPTARVRRASSAAPGSVSALSQSLGGSAVVDEETEEDDDDDPFIPRPPRPTPQLNLIPLPARRYTFSATSRAETPNAPASDDDRDANPADRVDPLSINTDITSQLPIDLPAPPANALPAYSAHLGRDELRLISSVHMDQTHPAAAYFSHIAHAVNLGFGAQAEQEREIITGGKKLKLVLTKGAERLNDNAAGPVFIRLPREGIIEGRLEIGKVEYATRLDVAIIGLVNTSYYVRGQYTLIDTQPLVRRIAILYPPQKVDLPAPADNAEAGSGNTGGTTATTEGAPPASESAGPSVAQANTTAARPSAPEPNDRSPSGCHEVYDNHEAWDVESRLQTVGKDGLPYLTQGTKFNFSLRMPSKHYRDDNIELPPTASIFQIGMQAGVEYVLRVKMSRKGWRMSETITVPIVYEPRAYLSPRRLRAITTDDAMNPGWRTIKMHGGEPTKPAPSSTGTTTARNEGVQVTLLLPSPPILFIDHGVPPPPIPFHLHFHSSATHALATFSDPKECSFIIRLMRIATMKIGSEREIRRMEIPAKVEIWQEGGAKMTLGKDDLEPPSSPAFHAPATGTTSGSPAAPSAGASTGTTSGGGLGAALGRRLSATTERRQSFLRRLSLDRSASNDAGSNAQRQSTGVTSPVSPALARQPSVGQLQRQPSTIPSVVEEPIVPYSVNTPENSNASSPSPAQAPALHVDTTTEPSPQAPERNVVSLSPGTLTPTASPARTRPRSPLPTIEATLAEADEDNLDPNPNQAIEVQAEQTGAGATDEIGSNVRPSTSALSPLSLSSTDVHLLGQLTVNSPELSREFLRRLTQSFMTPEIGVTYVLEIGLQPRGGSVKEAFKHVWGGGLIEVVLGARPANASRDER